MFPLCCLVSSQSEFSLFLKCLPLISVCVFPILGAEPTGERFWNDMENAGESDLSDLQYLVICWMMWCSYLEFMTVHSFLKNHRLWSKVPAPVYIILWSWWSYSVLNICFVICNKEIVVPLSRYSYYCFSQVKLSIDSTNKRLIIYPSLALLNKLS